MGPNIRIGRACRADGGFTLVELMIVVAVIAVLSAAVVPAVASTTWLSWPSASKERWTQKPSSPALVEP